MDEEHSGAGNQRCEWPFVCRRVRWCIVGVNCDDDDVE